MGDERSLDYALVAIGGGAGALLRWGVGRLLPAFVDTITVNVLGTVVLGVLTTAFIERGVGSNRLQLVATTGFLSSFTTYSAFALESVFAADVTLFVTYVLATYGFGLAGGLFGRHLGRLLGGARS